MRCRARRLIVGKSVGQNLGISITAVPTNNSEQYIDPKVTYALPQHQLPVFQDWKLGQLYYNCLENVANFVMEALLFINSNEFLFYFYTELHIHIKL